MVANGGELEYHIKAKDYISYALFFCGMWIISPADSSSSQNSNSSRCLATKWKQQCEYWVEISRTAEFRL